MGFWDEDRQSEYEQIEETFDESAQAILDEMDGKVPEELEEEEMEEEYEEEEYMDDYEATETESAYTLDRRESSVVNESMIRLEQARLYDMLIKHDLFKGVKAHPHALQNVQNELKSYIVDRLEILLGIKQEKTKSERPRELVVDSPFNDVEIEFLKALSYKGTKGASLQAQPKQLRAAEIQSVGDDSEYEEEEPELAPVRRPAPPKPKAPVRKAPARKKKPVAKTPVKPKAPARKRKPTAKKPATAKKTKGITRKSRRKEMSDKEAEEIAREDMKRMSGYNKPAHEMTAKELIAANKKIAQKNQKVRPENAKEMATEAQASMLYQQQQIQQGQTGFNTLLQKVLHDKNK